MYSSLQHAVTTSCVEKRCHRGVLQNALCIAEHLFDLVFTYSIWSLLPAFGANQVHLRPVIFWYQFLGTTSLFSSGSAAGSITLVISLVNVDNVPLPCFSSRPFLLPKSLFTTE